MVEINKENVFAIINDDGTHRKQFSQSSGIQKNKPSPTFSVPFDQGLCQHFRDGTGKSLRYNARFDQHYCFLPTEADIQQVEAWVARQGTRVFIRNTLDSSLALDVNFVDNTSGEKTAVGANEEAAKHHQDPNSIANLSKWGVATVQDIAFLREADYVCAIPALPTKGFDLPTRLAESISASLGKMDLTPLFALSNKTKSLKECSLEEKWDAWSATKIEYTGPNLMGASVILIDDKYQSGVTQQYFGMVLRQLGCTRIHGLCMVKTLRDTDNVQVVDG